MAKDLYRIGITGSYGGLNLGDEAILHSIVTQLRRDLPVEITVFSRDPEDTKRRHGVERAVPVRKMSRAEASPEVEQLDLLIIGGGGILFDAEARIYLREAQIAKEKGAFEAMLIRDGVVTEGTKTNFFGVVDGALRTHPCDNHILPGITRSVLRDLAREVNIELDETPIRVDEIPRLSELFLTGTTTDVMPVVTLDGQPVGKGKPGELTRKLQKVLAESLASGD